MPRVVKVPETESTDETVVVKLRVAPALMKAAEAAQYLGVSVVTFYDYVAHDLIDVVRLPKRSLDRKNADSLKSPRRTQQFRKQDLDAFIERNLQPSSAPIDATEAAKITVKNHIERDWWKHAKP